MSSINPDIKKATTLKMVDSVVQFNIPVGPDHEFFTDFSDVRGDFEDRIIYKALKVDTGDYSYDHTLNFGNKSIVFLAGMRGSGKTSELAKIASKLHKRDCFFCVICNLDEGLDINDMEYMDVLIFQLERLLYELDQRHLDIDDRIFTQLHNWFAERINEVNTSIKSQGGFEIQVGVETPSFLSFFKLATKLKASLMGSKENATKVRTVFKNNFTVFAEQINTFFEEINVVLRDRQIAKEILFIVDGLEKVATKEIRRRMIEDEINRIQLIKANAIFTLPLELMSLRQKLIQFSTFATFPFVKIKERNGAIVPNAIQRFKEFVYKRIDKSLFDDEETVLRAIQFGGGSPRELLRILEYANFWSDSERNLITSNSLERALKKLAGETSQYVSEANLELLKVLKKNNDESIPTAFGLEWQDLLEKIIVMEYNDGTFKCVNPIVEMSDLYQHYVAKG